MVLEVFRRLCAGARTAAIAGLLIAGSPSAQAQDDAEPSAWADPQVEAAPDAPPAENAAPTGAGAETVDVVPLPAVAPEPPPAAEAAPDDTRLDTVEVTGSRIRRSDYETESPVLVISREDIERTGLVAIGDILQNLPQAGAALSRAFNNGGNGETHIDLRNLGAERVLVLVNGRRWVTGTSQFSTAAVDLNTIPISVVETIEVLKDGASAVYGSDAIAGVINIKTRRDYVGAELRNHVEQILEHGDGFSQALSLSGGTVAGRTSVFFDVSYVNQGELRSGDREQSAIPTFGTGITRGSGNSPFGKAIFVTDQQNADAINAAAGTPMGPAATCRDISAGVAYGAADNTGENGAGRDPVTGQPTPAPGVNPGLSGGPEIDFPAGVILCDWTLDRAALQAGARRFVRYDRNLHAYNYAPENYLITPSERASIFGQFAHQISDGIGLSGELLYNVRKSSQQLAPTPVPIVGDALGSFTSFKPFSTVYVDRTNPYNPTNPQSPYYIPGTRPQDFARSAGDAGLPVIGYGAANIRFNDLGPRLFSQNVDTMRIGLGLNGAFEGGGSSLPVLDALLSRYYAWDFGYVVGESRNTDVNAGLVNMERLGRALGPVDQCIATDATTPPPAAAGCVPIDIFGGPGAMTAEMLDYVKYTAIDTAVQRQRLGYANASTEIGELGRWLAGPLGVAAGIEVREEYYKGQPDPLKAAELSSTNVEKPTLGSYLAREAYLEFRLPLLADKPYAEELELSLAERYSSYTGFGDNLSGKFGVRYKPIRDLIVRGTLSDSFRAPSIGDLYQGQATGYPEVQDICADYDDPARDGELGIENTRQNCQSDGVPPGVSSGNQVATTFGGNPELDPETARTTSVGFVYSPRFLPDFNFYLDWYRVQLEDFIGGVSPAIIQQLCYAAPPDSRAYCDLIRRETGDDRQIVAVTAVSQNYAGLEVEGIDFNFDWVLPFEALAPYGQFKWTLDAAYTIAYNQIVPTGVGETEVGLVGFEFGGGGAVPRWKATSGLTWSLGNFAAAWNLRYVHHLVEPCDDGLGDPGVANGGSNPTPVPTFEEFGLCSDTNNPVFGKANELSATFYNDLQGSWSPPDWNARIVFGVNNVLDQDPPVAVSAFADSYDKSVYDPWGSRTPYLRINVGF